jgi:hypothetical protein
MGGYRFQSCSLVLLNSYVMLGTSIAGMMSSDGNRLRLAANKRQSAKRRADRISLYATVFPIADQSITP